MRQNITHEEIVMHIDFSENFCCKYSSEIQSMHFGASRRQISLHTGVAYIQQEVIPFCSVSDSLKHGPGAIWAHLHPVLIYLQTLKTFTNIHFISDGPTTQYRNKSNFYLWHHNMHKHGFSKSTWNFIEAAHGKGAADGIGAAIKRNADKEVNLRKKDITDAKAFIEALKTTESRVKLFLIDEESIEAMESKVPNTLQAIPNTMKIHQVKLLKYLACVYLT